MKIPKVVILDLQRIRIAYLFYAAYKKSCFVPLWKSFCIFGKEETIFVTKKISWSSNFIADYVRNDNLGKDL